jgi:hypothetical protein
MDYKRNVSAANIFCLLSFVRWNYPHELIKSIKQTEILYVSLITLAVRDNDLFTFIAQLGSEDNQFGRSVLRFSDYHVGALPQEEHSLSALISGCNIVVNVIEGIRFNLIL